MPARAVIGRDEELEAIETFLGDVERGPTALVLSGEPGIGKTILWEAGVEEARQRVGRVLIARGAAAEASLSFAGLSELLGDVLDEVRPSLAPPRRHALEVALLLAEPGETPLDPHAIGLALLDVLRALTQHGPVLVALDDVQWLDPASAGAIQIALRRLRGEPFGLLATVRLGPELESPLELERSMANERLERLSVGPLSLGALHSLLQQQLGLDLTRPELARVQEATAGNPFFALEFGRELQRTGIRPVPGQPLHVPDSLRELLGDRLARLPGETLDILLEVAALARPTVEVVAAAHGDRERVLAGLEEAAGEGVIEVEGSRLRFAHPLLASICYEDVPVLKRRAVHGVLAEVVGDLEERARHLSLAAEGPDVFVAAELEAAAEQAEARGAAAAAAELYELAADMTPDDPALSRRRRLQAARWHRLSAGVGGRAVPILEQLLTEVPSGVERSDILFELASKGGADSRTAVELCTEALAEAADDGVRATRILCLRSLFRALSDDVPGAHDDARLALEQAEQIGDPTLLAMAIARAGTLETWTGDVTPGLLERGTQIEEHLERPLGYHQSPRIALARRLLHVGEVDQARGLLEKVDALAAARGDEDTRIMILAFNLVALEWFAGRWQQALGHAVTAYDLAAWSQDLHGRGTVGYYKALIEADLGLVEEARASAEEALAFSQRASNEWFIILNLAVLGRLELALGNLEPAAAILRELPERLLVLGLTSPTNPVWADAIETLIAVGELEQARTYTETFQAHAKKVASPCAIVAAARCRGLLAAIDGDMPAAFDAFETALEEFGTAPFPLERARTLLCLGTVRRQAQQKKAAREDLEQALAIFDELGARLWADKARAELARISGRAPASEELTKTEGRVAELAARGRTNKEIAAELYMGVSTVESHLSHIYRKLGVRRAELATRLTVPQGEDAKAGGEPVQT